MDVQIRSWASRFADLPPGTLFCALRTERIFGLSITDGHHPAAFLFNSVSHQSGVPWVAPGGLNDDLVSFPAAVIRTDPLSVSGPTGPIPFGAIIQFEDKFCMRASNGLGSFMTCDVVTGSIVTIPVGSVLNLYSN